jgi:hypothetical protein
VVQTSRIRALFRLLAVLAVLAATAGTAAAATPFTLAPGEAVEDPHIAVDETGVGHFVWSQDVPYVSAENPGHDVMHYCQVPRNGTACTKTKAITLPKDDFAGPRVLLHPNGAILLLSQRCCGSSPGVDSLDILWVVGSADGGNTWSEPKAIGTIEPSGDALLGPGEFSVSVITSIVTGGTLFQAAPLSGFTDARANVGDRGEGINNPYADGGIAYLDPLTPITAMSDGDRVFARKWGGSGDYNNIASWGPIQDVAAGDTPRIVGGKKGVYLAYQGNDFRFRVSRWGGMAFGAPSFLTPTGDSPYEPDFFEDKSGALHFVWRSNNAEQIHMRESKDGATWGPVKSLTPGTGSYFGIETATARDGGGWVVWDQNSSGPIRAVQYGPTGPVSDPGGTDAGCPEELDIGGGALVAREGCFKKKPGTDQYTTKGDIRVNGVDVYTPGAQGSSAKAAVTVTITIDKSARTLITEGGKVEVRVGNVVLDRAALKWKIPSGSGVIQDLAGNPAPFDTGKFDVEFLGLDVLGQTTPTLLKDGSVEIPVHLALPEPLGGVGGIGNITGDILLRADVEKGLQLSNLKIHADHVGIGIAEIDPLDIEYVGDPSKLYGKVNLVLPVIDSELETEFQLTAGSFDYGRAKLTLPGQGIAVATGVFVKAINFGIFLKPKPTKITGGVQINALGQIGGTAVLQVDGQVSYTFPNAPNPGVFRVDGHGKLIGLDFADVFAQYETSGKVSFGGDIRLGNENTLGITGGASGAVDINTLQFTLLGKAHVCALSICALGSEFGVNNSTVAGCVGGSDLGVGAKFTFATKSIKTIWTCDLSEYAVLASSHISQAGARTVKVKGGQKLASLQIFGEGAPPRVQLRGPGGQIIASPSNQAVPVRSDVGLLFADAESRSTIVNLRKPQGGSWTITLQPGSAAVSSVRVANALPEPSVKAVVTGRGHKRALDWTVRPIAGQRVRLSEEGRGAHRSFGVLKGRSGRVRFSPANGKAGKRTLLAVVEQDGLFRKSIVAGTYTAPGPVRPGRPRNVRLRRRGTTLVVTWGRASNAVEYAVQAKLKDGRRLVLPTKKRRLAIRNVPGIDSGSIAVYGLKADRTAGPAGKAKLRAKPKKRKRRPR